MNTRSTAKISRQARVQIRNIRGRELVAALRKDGFIQEKKRGANLIFVKEVPGEGPRRVSIHYHPTKTFPPKTLKAILDSTGWTDVDLIDLRLIK